MEMKKPRFKPGRNIAMKIPADRYEKTVMFYKDVIGLEPIEEDENTCSFQFGEMVLWLDKMQNMKHSEIWLEINTNNTKSAAEYLKVKGIHRRDEVEKLPEGLDAFWISNPANVIHLVSKD